ncbi:MAG TPA: Clp protease N-terminal domain-containing protein [Nakamurella sp.]
MLSGLRRARADIATMNVLFPSAERIARADGVDRPGAEHLLLAALDLDDGIALAALAENGVDRQQLHDAIRAQHTAALRSVGVEVDDAAIDRLIPPPVAPAGVYRSQGSMQDLFQRSAELAKAAGRPLLSGDVLMAALDADHGTVAPPLSALRSTARPSDGTLNHGSGVRERAWPVDAGRASVAPQRVRSLPRQD